ncbi:MAG TPA: hypothetical protein VFN71_12105 [Methylomirabilota bacterium]|nr:hypothetical protein [Methylomirabilota bacterium]
MSPTRVGSRCLLVLLACGWLGAALPADAVSFALTPREREEAIRVGRKSITSEEFGAEWRVSVGSDRTVTVMTPFHRLALAARNSAFRNQELTPRQVESLLREHEGKLVVWVTLRDGKADFARFYAPVLVVEQQQIKANFTQNERTALRGEDGKYTARCMYVFPAAELNPKGKVTLIVRDPDERPVAKFTVDLAAMR